jgi:hypothetical protein
MAAVVRQTVAVANEFAAVSLVLACLFECSIGADERPYIKQPD